MELKEFIKQTIIDITNGIQEGHSFIQTENFGKGINTVNPIKVNFDVAVSTNQEKTSGIGGKISVVDIFSANGKNEQSLLSSNISRINFHIFVDIDTPK